MKSQSVLGRKHSALPLVRSCSECCIQKEIAAYCKNSKKHINSLYGKNANVLIHIYFYTNHYSFKAE